MEMQGSRQIAAPRDAVWAALNDPEVLKASIPGCDEMTGDAEDGFVATVRQKIGPVSASFSGTIRLTDVVLLTSYTLTAEGRGGVAGFGRGSAAVRLADAEGGTLLTYALEAHVGGKLAHLGPRIVHGFAKRIADSFFDNFRAALEPRTAPRQDADAADGERRPGWLRRIIDRTA